MTEPGAAERAVDEAVARFGSLDILVNNVGSGRPWTGFADEPDAHWSEVFELNLMTAVRTTRAALPHLVASGGVVVNVSSVNGHLPSPFLYAYSADKAAMDNLTVGLSREFAARGVRVVGVAPGPVDTPLWLGPTGLAATVAARSGKRPADRRRRGDGPLTGRPFHNRGGGRRPDHVSRKRACRHDHRDHHPHRRRRYTLAVVAARVPFADAVLSERDSR
jgi:NAD(P)-dependent dehydrogenase (short-subunit alcohol dehydrogenase family)